MEKQRRDNTVLAKRLTKFPPLAGVGVVPCLMTDRSLGSRNSLFLSRASLERDEEVEGRDEHTTTGHSRGRTAAWGLAPR